MKKKILLIMGVFSLGLLHAQIGINTDSPQALFHVKGVLSDLVITADGKVGIGTVTPSNKLSIVSSGTNTGLQLPNGKLAGSILESDISGNGRWNNGAVQYQTMVQGTGGLLAISGATMYPINPYKLTFFSSTIDKAKEIYGPTYGWDNTNQQYVAPVTGVYRIAYSAYFYPQKKGVIGGNMRAYLFKNGAQFPTPGIVSVTDAGSDILGYTMGVATLNKGDIIDLRVFTNAFGGNISLHGGIGHTFILIESL